MRRIQTMRSGRPLAFALGWLSVGMGLVDVLMTRRVAREIGMRGQEASLRACGLREIATGTAIVVARDPTPYVWARVAGDALDLALLGRQALVGGPQAGRAALAAVGVAGLMAADLVCAQTLGRDTEAEGAVRFDYGGRTGMPLPASEMRGVARADFVPPEDMRVPAPLRAYGTS